MTTNREITTTNIIEELHIAHEQLVGGLRDTFEAALEIGRLLTDQKASLAHGQFLPWLEKNVAFISESTCRRCMRLHRNREMLKSVNVTDLSSAYKLLAAPKKSDDDVVEAVEAPCAEAVAPIDRDQLNRRRLRQKKHDMVKAELATMRAKADALEVEVVDHGGDEVEVVDHISRTEARDPLEVVEEVHIQQDADSSTLFHLKRYWKQATEKDRKTFMEWIDP